MATSLNTKSGYILTGPLAEGVRQIAEEVAAQMGVGGGPITLAAATDVTTINLPLTNTPLASILASLQAQILAIPTGGGGGGTGTSTPFATAVKYDLNYRYYPGVNLISANTTMTRDETGAIPFGQTSFTVQMDGSHTLDLTALGIKVGSQVLNNTAGQQYDIVTWKNSSGLAGGFRYGVILGDLVDVTKPSPVSAVVSDTNPLEILIAWSKVINSTVSAAAAFGISAGHTFSAHTYVDSTHTKLVVTTPFIEGETARTLSYVVPGVNPMKDTAGTPNLADAFSGFAIVNNVTTPTVTLSVEDATPSRIDFTFNQAMDQTSTPANVDFAMSVGTATGFAWDDSTHGHATTSHTFVAGDVITLNYTGGTNKFKDLAGGNLLQNFTGKAITNNVVGASGILSYANVSMTSSINMDDAGITDWIVPAVGRGAQNYCKLNPQTLLNMATTGTLGVDQIHAGGGLGQTTNPATPSLSSSATINRLGGGATYPGSDISGNNFDLKYDNGGATPTWTFTVPAGLTTQTVDILWGSPRLDAYSITGAHSLTASLSDASASPITVNVGAASNNNEANVLRTRITFKAATAGQTLTFGFPAGIFFLPCVLAVMLGHE